MTAGNTRTRRLNHLRASERISAFEWLPCFVVLASMGKYNRLDAQRAPVFSLCGQADERVLFGHSYSERLIEAAQTE